MEKTYKQLINELGQSGQVIAWRPGLTLRNANGDISSTTLGYQYVQQTTQLIRAKVVEQHYYTIPVADYVPTIIGDGAWKEGFITNMSFDSAGDFESGIIDTADPSNLAQVSVGIAPVTAKVVTWAKGYEYSVVELEKAAATGNWDVVQAKQNALRRNWDLGLQQIAFLGSKVDPAIKGLLSNAAVNVSTSVITQAISANSPTQYNTLIGALLQDYFANSNSTAMPDTLVIPMSDYLGMGSFVAPSFPQSGLTFLEAIEQWGKKMTQNANFKILGCVYCNKATNAGYWAGGGTNRYVLYRRDPETIRMDIPVDFKLLPPGTADNFRFQGPAVGQYTGVQVYRPAEVRYYDWG